MQNHDPLSGWRSRTGVLITLLTSAFIPAQAQTDVIPSAVDARLVKGSDGNELLLQVRTHSTADFGGILSALTATIRYDASSGASLGTGTSFCNAWSAFTPSPVVVNAGIAYRTYNGFGSNRLEDPTGSGGCGVSFVPEEWFTITTIPVGGSTCTSFTLGNDAWTASANRDYYISMGGVEVTGAVIGGPVSAGNCAADCAGNLVVVAINTDANGDQTTWQIRDEANAVIASGGPYPGQNNTLVTDTVCLGDSPVDACYGFKLFDSFGDGLSGTGKWRLRTTSGKVLLGDGFDNGSVTPASPQASPSYGGSHSFCLPEGNSNIKSARCNLFTNTLNSKVICDAIPGATQYQFEFSDPDAGFVRRITRNTNSVHFGDMVTDPLTPGVHYFVRVRTNANGPIASAHFGPGCGTGLGVSQVLPCSELISAPAYGHSCNETRPFNSNGYIYAHPVNGATQYQFHLFNVAEGYDTTITRNTYILALHWNGSPLVDGSTYHVEINVFVNGLQTGFCPSSCTITISNGGNRPEARMAMRDDDGDLQLWPNPAHDGQVNLLLTGLVDPDQLITVDIYDVYGKQVLAKNYENSGDGFNTIMDLPHDIASGIYLVDITVNGNTTIQRLSVIK